MTKYIALLLLLFPAAILSQSTYSSGAGFDTVYTYYDNNQVESKIATYKGVRDGEASFYWENGNLKQKMTYYNGKVQGAVLEYWESGKPKMTYTIENGLRQGPIDVFDSSGVFIANIYYDGGLLVPEVAEASEEEKQRQVIVDPAFYQTAEVMPEPEGGLKAIQDKLVYPEFARDYKIEGTVEVLVFVDAFGNIVDTRIEKEIGYGCEEAAINAIKAVKFKPGTLGGNPANLQIMIPVVFKLKNR